MVLNVGHENDSTWTGPEVIMTVLPSGWLRYTTGEKTASSGHQRWLALLVAKVSTEKGRR